MNLPSKEFIEVFKNTAGAISVSESIAIFNVASEAPEGVYLELGSHKGKSGMSAAQGLKDGVFHLVDPIFEDQNLSLEVCERVKSSGVPSVVMIADYSTNVIEKYTDLAFVFLDSGSHADGLPMQEVKLLEDRVKQGGIICFHDYGNQFWEVKEAADYLVSTGKYEPVHINWDAIRNYVKENNLELGNNSWHMPGVELPCFVGAVRRK